MSGKKKISHINVRCKEMRRIVTISQSHNFGPKKSQSHNSYYVETSKNNSTSANIFQRFNH